MNVIILLLNMVIEYIIVIQLYLSGSYVKINQTKLSLYFKTVGSSVALVGGPKMESLTRLISPFIRIKGMEL